MTLQGKTTIDLIVTIYRPIVIHDLYSSGVQFQSTNILPAYHIYKTIKFTFKRTVCPVFLMKYCPIIPRKPYKVQ